MSARRVRRRASRRQLVVGGVLFVLIDLGMLALGISGIVDAHHGVRSERPIPGGVATTGRVVDYQQTYIARGGFQYRPVVVFTDQAGQQIRFTGVQEADRPTIGAAATVSYDPSNPSDAHDLSDSTRLQHGYEAISIILLCIFGSITLILLAGAARVRLLRGRRKPS